MMKKNTVIRQTTKPGGVTWQQHCDGIIYMATGCLAISA